MDPPFAINSGSTRSNFSSTICIPSFFMPLKNHKKAITSTCAPTQGCTGQHKNTTEVITDSGNEFEHLTVDARNRYIQTSFFYFIFWYLHVFISLTALLRRKCLRSVTMKWKVEDDNELALTPCLCRTGPPSTPFPH